MKEVPCLTSCSCETLRFPSGGGTYPLFKTSRAVVLPMPWILLTVSQPDITRSGHKWGMLPRGNSWELHTFQAPSRLRSFWVVHHISPDPNLPIHFVTFTALRRRLSHVLIAFSHYEGYKVYCACAVSRDLCVGGPPKPHVTIFFWPRIAYSLYNFYAATMTIKGSLY